MKIFLLTLTVIFSWTSYVVPGNNPIHFENFFTVDRLGTPVVSSDGKLVAFTVKNADISENNYSTQIWIMNSDGSGLKQGTAHSSSSSAPVFSSDGNSLYFLSSRSGSSQVWQKMLNGEEAQQVTDFYGNIEKTGFAL